MKDTVFFYFGWLPLSFSYNSCTQAHLKQNAEMETPYQICDKSVSLTFIIASTLSEILHKDLFYLCKINKHYKKHCFILF